MSRRQVRQKMSLVALSFPKAIQKMMRDSRRTALYEPDRELYEVGSNAVVGVDLDYGELVLVGNMVLLLAPETAVRVE